MMPMSITGTRQAWVEFLSEQAYTHAVTLKPNHKAERATAQFLRSAFVRFHRDVDQALLGSRYHRPAKRHLRTEAVGIIEGLPFTGHIHAAFRVAPGRWADFERLFQPLSSKITVKASRANPWVARITGGTTVVERITDARGWLSYSTKGFGDIDAADRIIFLPLDA